MANYDARQFAKEVVELVKNTPKEELDKLTPDQIVATVQKTLDAKTPQALEVRVADETKILDKVMDAIAYIVKAIQEWVFSNVDKPLTISIRKLEARGPPSTSKVLSVGVGEVQKTKTGLV